MSSRYQELVSPREAQVFYPESIPHLLHQDLAYLWMLRRKPDLRPPEWRARLRGWKHLLSLFLIGELKLEPINSAGLPLGDRMREAGLSGAFWLRLKAPHGAQGRIVGVSSTTVIVRPLPRFDEELGRLLETEWSNRQRPIELAYFARLLVQKIGQLGGGNGLDQVISGELLTENTPGIPSAGREVQLSLLTKVAWSGASEFETLAIDVRTEGPAAWAPRCTQCNRFLPGPESTALDVVVGSPVVDIPCAQCGAQTPVELDRFLVWQRDVSRVVVWKSASSGGVFPPLPAINGIDVNYSWTSAELEGAAAGRLVLRFRDRDVRTVRLEECFFRDVLLFDDPARFEGLPVKAEWLDALEDPSVAVREIRRGPAMLEYNLAIHGYPQPFIVRRLENSWKRSTGAGVALYPNPSTVGAAWRLYRSYVIGTDDVQIVGAHGWRNTLSTLGESQTGCPSALTLQGNDAQAGATFMCPAPPAAAGGTARLAVDFGTSNSIIYAEDAAGRPQPVEPRVRETAHWFGNVPSQVDSALLPSRPASPDPASIPSALWCRDSAHLIRWNERRPSPAFQPLTGFKWDRRDIGRDFSSERLAYLREVLFFTIPRIAAERGPISSLELGVTFPLAFDHQQKERFSQTITALKSALHRDFGIDVTADYSISESAACVRAHGLPAQGETFLVADMGGGTLDVALVSAQAHGDRSRLQVHQIGSLRIGGEEFVAALRRAGVSEDEWAIRDAIAKGEAARRFGADRRVLRMLRRFTDSAFEFLRTMVLSHRLSDQAAPIQLILVGNGWHLVDAFSRDAQVHGAKALFKEYFDDLIRASALPLTGIAPDGAGPSKHLPARGALHNVTTEHRRELSETVELTRLPAGRSFTIGEDEVSWSTLVGDGRPLKDVAPEQFNPALFAFTSAGPELPPEWSQRLVRSFDVTSPAQLPSISDGAVREQMARDADTDRRTVKRGPLQVIIEHAWLPNLENGL